MGLSDHDRGTSAGASPVTAAVRRNEVLRILRAHEPDLRERFAVASLSLFGSVGRDPARRSSDVDLLVEFTRPVGLFHILRTADHVSGLLGGVEVDLVERAALLPALRDAVLAQVVDAFG